MPLLLRDGASRRLLMVPSRIGGRMMVPFHGVPRPPTPLNSFVARSRASLLGELENPIFVTVTCWHRYQRKRAFANQAREPQVGSDISILSRRAYPTQPTRLVQPGLCPGRAFFVPSPCIFNRAGGADRLRLGCSRSLLRRPFHAANC